MFLDKSNVGDYTIFFLVIWCFNDILYLIRQPTDGASYQPDYYGGDDSRSPIGDGEGIDHKPTSL